MKTKIRFFSILIFAFIMLIMFSTEAHAGSQKLNSLEYKVTLNKDGSADITEIWDVTASETNTLFKTFKTYSSETGMYEFSNVKVKDASKGYTYREIDEQQYHVDPGCYYGLKTNATTFEIAWNIGADSTTLRKTYEISYKVKDAIQNGKDCAQFYWQFIAKDNTMRAQNVSATITLPQSMETETECKMFAHGPLYGTIHQTAPKIVVAKIPELDINTMFEVRIVMPDGIFTNSKTSSTLTLASVLEEEGEWADQANKERGKIEAQKKLIKIVNVCIYILDLFFVYCLIKAIKTHIKTKKEYQIGTIEYFRDIPYENATPGECIFMRKGQVSYYDSSNLIMATILNFHLKGIVELVEFGEDTVIVVKFNAPELATLKDEEKEIYNLLKNVARDRNTDKITFDNISNYIEEEYRREVPRLEAINGIVKREEIKRGMIDQKAFSSIGLGGAMFIFICFGGMMMMPLLAQYPEIILSLTIAVIILLVLLCVKSATKGIKKYTLQGSIEKEQWKGLEKFMKDYSRIDERGPMDIILWEHYLVFAAALDVADDLLKELKIVYPQFEEEYGRRSRVIHMVNSTGYRRSMKSLDRTMSSSHERMYPSESSSGSGGGGGFSGGGGGRRRRRKHGRKIIKFFL